MNKSEKFNYFLKHCFWQYVLVPIIAFIFIILNWTVLSSQKNATIETNIAAYQQTELEIVRGAARSVESYIRDATQDHGRTDITELEQEIFKDFIAPIHLLENGDAWIYAPEYIVFDLSEDFPAEYFGKSMAEIFVLQKINGASHYEAMTADVSEAKEGIGWYIWLPEKGKEIAAWTPVQVGEYIWTIGLSTPLPEILEATGAANQIRILDMIMGGGTVAVLILLVIWVTSAIRQRKSQKELIAERAQLLSLFDSLDEIIYVSDPETYEILYVNQTMQEAFQKELEGGICYKEIQGLDAPCEFCTNEIILKANPAPYYWEYHNLKLQKDYKVVDRIITWPDGRDVRFEFAQDITERKKALQELEARRNLFTNSFESSSTGMIMTRMDGHFLLVNTAFCKMLGYSNAELQKKTLQGVTYPEDAEKSTVYLRRLMDGKTDSYDNEKRYVRKDGSIFWAEVRVSAVRGKAGDLQYLFRHILDITERKEAEEKLRESEKRYKYLFDSAPDGVSILDKEGRILECSESMMDLYGYTQREKLCTKHITDLMSAPSVEIFKKEFSKLKQLIPTEGEIQIAQPNGNIVDLWRKAFPLTDSKGDFSGVLLYDRNITERVRAERGRQEALAEALEATLALQNLSNELEERVEERTVALSESEEKYRLLTELTKDVIIRLSTKGEILFVSSAIKHFGGYEAKDEIGKEMTNYFALEEDIIRAEELLLKTIETRKSGRFEFLFKAKDGKKFPVEHTYLPIIENDKVGSIQLVLRDMSERKKMEQALAEKSIYLDNILRSSTEYAIATTDLDFHITYYNPQAEQFFGYKAEDVIGKTVAEIHVMENVEAERLEKAIENVRRYGEHRYRVEQKMGGGIRYLDSRVSGVYDFENELIGFALFSRDVSKEIQAKKDLKESEARYRLLAENTSDFVWIADIERLTLTYASPSVENLLGFTAEEIVSIPLKERLTPEFSQKVSLILEEELEANKKGGDPERTRVIEAGIYHKKGHIIWIETTARFIYNDKGEPKGLMGAARDITERKKTEKELKKREHYLYALNEAAQILLPSEEEIPYQAFLNTIGPSSQASRTYIFLNHFGDQGEKLMSQVAEWCAEGIAPEIDNPELQNLSYDNFFPRWHKTLTQGETISGKVTSFPKKEREILRPQDIQAILIIPLIVDEEFLGFIGFDNCLSEREWDTVEQSYLRTAASDLSQTIKRYTVEGKLRYQATTDPLTKTFNRRYFFETAQKELERAQRYEHALSIIIFDLDRFKKVNDTYGHGVGDEVLRRISALNKENLRENDIFARYGGEEFVILLPETNLEQAYQMAERMRKKCAPPLQVGENSINVTISFGVSSLGKEKLLLDQLLRRADKALYKAKKGGRNQVRVWKEETSN